MATILTTFAFLFPFIVAVLSQGYRFRDEDFSIELIDRDHSPHSPFYNPSDTHSTRLRKSIRRSMSRIHRIHHSSSKPTTFQSELIPADAGHFTKFSVGSPPFEVIVIVDTGSDLTWIQCLGCSCFEQNTPIFDPDKSSTFKNIPCKSKTCQNLLGDQCSDYPDVCPYGAAYGDGAYSIGTLATDTLTFDSTNRRQSVSIPEFIFGCGFNNSGTFSNSTGIIGLSNSPFSILSQLGLSKFSYCLVPVHSNETSTLKFGKGAQISGEGIVSIPLIFKPNETFYYVSFEGISVGNKRFTMTTLNATQGNVIVDSGTTLTSLPTGLYNMVKAELKKAIGFIPTKDPSGDFNLCYNTKFDIKVPVITFHFTGADLKLSKSNTFSKDIGYDLECFTIVPDDEVPIFGNLMQKNFQVEYDLRRKMLSFLPADCTKF